MFILNKKCIQFVNLDDTMFQKNWIICAIPTMATELAITSHIG